VCVCVCVCEERVIEPPFIQYLPTKPEQSCELCLLGTKCLSSSLSFFSLSYFPHSSLALSLLATRHHIKIRARSKSHTHKHTRTQGKQAHLYWWWPNLDLFIGLIYDGQTNLGIWTQVCVCLCVCVLSSWTDTQTGHTISSPVHFILSACVSIPLCESAVSFSLPIVVLFQHFDSSHCCNDDAHHPETF